MEKDNVISRIEENSIAFELGIESGDMLLTVNGKKPQDILEYRYLIDDEFIILEIQKKDGEIWEFEIEKDYGDNLGIQFEEEIMDKPKNCHNNCIFCFINQLPKGMRDSLYFKDDDTRLSFLYGNYVTLTNLKDEEIDRIIQYRLQPINISVHTTNSKLRVQMLNNKKAHKINDLLEKFYVNQIVMNIQIVLVPDCNDKEELDKTLKDLIALYPYVHSISVVPVGLTQFRSKLIPLRNFTKEECKQTVEQIRQVQSKMQENFHENVVYPSDEFFIKGEEPIPNPEYYGEFLQIENGVGMVALFNKEIRDALDHEYVDVIPKEINIITGVLAYDFIEAAAREITNKYPVITIRVIKIVNRFFGEEITVAGLITGNDIIGQLKDLKLKGDILFPSSMLRFEQDMFLDDIRVEDIENSIHCKLFPVEVDGVKFVESILY